MVAPLRLLSLCDTARCAQIAIFPLTFMMPGLWMGGVLLYLGFGAAYGIYVVVKLTLILGAHSA